MGSAKSFPVLPHVYQFQFVFLVRELPRRSVSRAKREPMPVSFWQYLEPISTMFPALMAWTFPGTAWFHHQLIPSSQPTPSALPGPRATLAVWELANCMPGTSLSSNTDLASTEPLLLMLLGYHLPGLIGFLVLRAARDVHRDNLSAQEGVVKAYLTALTIADVCSPKTICSSVMLIFLIVMHRTALEVSQ